MHKYHWHWAESIYFLKFMELRNRFQGMNSASLCSLAGRYDNPIPTRFLAPIDCLKIPALVISSPVFFLAARRPASNISTKTRYIVKNILLWTLLRWAQQRLSMRQRIAYCSDKHYNCCNKAYIGNMNFHDILPRDKYKNMRWDRA